MSTRPTSSLFANRHTDASANNSMVRIAFERAIQEIEIPNDQAILFTLVYEIGECQVVFFIRIWR